MKIIADTATLIPPSEGDAHGLTVMPVCVAINNRTYQDYSEISSAEFLELIRQGGVPTSSQPAIGDILDIMDSSDEEMLVLTVGDGLSGGYQTAMGARNLASRPERIQVMDSKTLAGPLRYLAKKAVALKEQNFTMEQIKANLQRCMDFLLACILGYLIGAVPFAYIIGKLFYHTDVREKGSGNLLSRDKWHAAAGSENHR